MKSTASNRARSKKQKALQFIESHRYRDALPLLEYVCKKAPGDGNAWLMLGVAHGQLGNQSAAIECSRKAVRLMPHDVRALDNLALGYQLSGDAEKACDALSQRLELDPQHRETVIRLANGFLATGKADQSIDIYQAYLDAHPDEYEIHMKLGVACEFQGYLARAEVHFRKVMDLRPGFSGAQQNYANVLSARGMVEEAVENYRAALINDPGNNVARSNYLLTLHYMQEYTPQEVVAEHVRCMAGACRAGSVPSIDGDLDNSRPLRIGFVSPDMRTHSVAYFLEPLLESMSDHNCMTFCYADVGQADATTDRLRKRSNHWRNIADMSISAICTRIRSDKIDILVDLAGHTSSRNLAVFALRPADVQATWLGYPNTTGLACMDYRLTDQYADPEGSATRGTEKLVRLDDCFLCYKALPETPDVSGLPAMANGYVTFGSFNNLAKINEGVLQLWAVLLQQVPNSRLYIKNPSFTDEATRDHYRDKLVALGVDAPRLSLVGRTRNPVEHLGLYANIDIALDTFPYNGTTTTCEALWMGVPVVAREGAAHAGRVGVSLLNAVGRNEWIGKDSEDYLRIAAGLASNLDELDRMRADLRDEMRRSKLCDSRRFSEKFQQSMRNIRAAHCASAL